MANTEMSEEEIKELKRQKQLRIIKASNELLEYVKETAKNTDKITDELTRIENIKAIDIALDENKHKAQSYLNATMEEVNDSDYVDASEAEKKKYQKRLEKKGITEDQLENVEVATVKLSDSNKKTSKRKKVPAKFKNKQFEKNEEIVRLDNEDELMKLTMATDEKILEKRKRDKQKEDKDLKKITDVIENKKIKNDNTIKEVADKSTDIEEVSKKSNKKRTVKYQFDTSKIPENTQYDIVPLPSKGECYPIDSPLRCGRVPVAFITASDENIIASPMMYRDDKIIDIILERKILLVGKEEVQRLTKGDRDAIILWLRANAYDSPNYPVVATNPNNGKRYDITVNVGEFNYKQFELVGDDDGCFDFTTSNGDLIKFRFLTKKDEEELIDKLYDKTNNSELLNILKYSSWIKDSLSNISSMDESDKEDIDGCISDIRDIVKENAVEMDDEQIIVETVTEQMILNTYSINDNTDREFIRSYIENMRSSNAFNYRKYINDNTPGVDFKITVDIPESDGGGSFTTFLKFDNTVFINL